MKNHWLISGVGRSGTTMVYGALLSAARAGDSEVLGRYEPFLWGKPTWDMPPGNIRDAFARTDSINARGVYAHTEVPLFEEDSHPVLDRFIDETLPAEHSVVAKVIRGAGRLSAFLHRDPDLRIVHLIRNPLDVINSALVYFSFFGGEFHPSVEPRFNEEAARRFASLYRPTFDLSEADRSLEWWRLMNEAALQTARRFPKRLKIVAYESLMSDLPRVMTDIVEFMGGTADMIDMAHLTDVVGPSTSSLSLRKVDRDALMPHVDAYFADRRIFGPKRNRIDVAATRARLIEKYKACTDGPAFVRAIDPNLAPTRVRGMATKAQSEATAARTAGAAQAKAIATEVSASVTALTKRTDDVASRVSATISALEKKLEDQVTALTARTGDTSAQVTASVSALESQMNTLTERADDTANRMSASVSALAEKIDGRLSASASSLEDTIRHHIEQLAASLDEAGGRRSAEVSDAVAQLSRQIAEAAKSSEARDSGTAALGAELSQRRDEIGALKGELESRDARIAELETLLAEGQALFDEAAKTAERDTGALRGLVDRLRDRVAALQDELASHAVSFERLRNEKRDVADKLRWTEERLRTVASEKERYRRQLEEFATVLAPRLSTVATLQPLRYVMRQRQRMKAGLVELDANGVPQPKAKPENG